jgi:RHS repeat-associated protein
VIPHKKQLFRGRRRIVKSWHRFYDPTTGRYISADPIGLGGGINLYGYVNGDPVNKVDPEGLEVPLPGDSDFGTGPAFYPTAPCEARQPCYNRAWDKFVACQWAVAAYQAACVALVTYGTEGVGILVAMRVCSIAATPKRAICGAKYAIDKMACDKILCCE